MSKYIIDKEQFVKDLTETVQCLEDDINYVGQGDIFNQVMSVFNFYAKEVKE